MLLFLADVGHLLALLGVLAHIGLLDLLLLLDRAHLLLCIEHVTRHLAMARDALDLRMSGILLLQRLLVIEIDALTWTDDAQLFGGIRLPHADVHFVGAGENVSIIEGPGHADHMLHAFCVVNIPRVTVVGIVDPNGLVVAGRDEFLASGRVVNIGDSGNMVKVNLQRRLQLASVKGIKAVRNKDFSNTSSSYGRFTHLQSSLATVKLNASMGFQASLLLFMVRTTFLSGCASL